MASFSIAPPLTDCNPHLLMQRIHSQLRAKLFDELTIKYLTIFSVSFIDFYERELYIVSFVLDPSFIQLFNVGIIGGNFSVVDKHFFG